MKKFKKIIISILLIAAIVTSLSSCGLVDRILRYYKDKKSLETGHSISCSCYPKYSGRYTGGFDLSDPKHNSINDYEIHWLETYEELLVAVEHLRAAGNTINISLPSYETDGVDAKYYISFKRKGSNHLEEGQEWYDRGGISHIDIQYYGFVDDVTIEELVYSYVSRYNCFTVYLEGRPSKDLELTYACLECHEVENETIAWVLETENVCFVLCGPYRFATIEYYRMENHTEMLPENFHEDLMESFVYIGD